MDKINTNDLQQQANDPWDHLGLSLPNTRPKALKAITDAYLSQVDPDDIISPGKIEEDIMDMVQQEFIQHNENSKPGTKWKIPDGLEVQQIVDILLRLYHVRTIDCSGGRNDVRDYDILGIYQEYGENAGIYVSDETAIQNLAWEYNSSLTTKQVEEVTARLKASAERVERCDDKDLIAVNNGIFNYKTKILEPFTPELVFTTKCAVNYDPCAKNPVIHNDTDNTDWDVETWIKELFEDGSDIPETIWQVMGAIIRPNVRWNKAAWFVSEKGNNGKGTLCELMRNLAGKNSYTSISLADFGKDFMLEPLIRSTCIITDENDVGLFIDKAANLKAVITNDVLQINRKFKTPVAYQFKGFMVQCVNEMPRVKDKSESFYRRQLFVPFKKCYTGVERKYIKNEYLHRKDVLEYVLFRILNMDYYELTEPDSCKLALETYKTYNDPIRDFLQEIMASASWCCIPNAILYDMYKGWSKLNNPNGSVVGKNTFISSASNLVDGKDGWEYCTEPKRVGHRMDCSEPLLNEYDCTKWMVNPNSRNIADRTNTDKKPTKARGLFRLDASKIIPVTGIVVHDED